jgi:hypothetical protein
MMRLWASYEKNKKYIKNTGNFFASLKSMKKGKGSGSISKRYGIRGSGSAPKCHGSPTLLSKVVPYETGLLCHYFTVILAG